jgi:hypothetical protein
VVLFATPRRQFGVMYTHWGRKDPDWRLKAHGMLQVSYWNTFGL